MSAGLWKAGAGSEAVSAAAHNVEMPRSFRYVPPDPRPDALVRPRLLRSLAERWHHRVTSLTGGAGLGKTTLLAQAIAENRMAPRGLDIWVGIEPHDADLDRLAHVVATALASAEGGDPAKLTANATVPEPEAVADAVWQQAPNEACFMLDDVHFLPEGSSGAAWLTGLVAALPANGHVVLASRSDPPVPLSRFGAQGSVLLLAEDDLRFSDDEVAGFAARRGLDPIQFDSTGGWPAMAELAASVGQRLTGKYLWEEVLEPLGTVRRHVLAVLCDLGGADDDLASAAVGASVELDDALDGVPLVARGADGWHVPHSLWRTAPAIELSPGERADIRRRAADHLTERGRFDAAFSLLQEAGLWDSAPRVLRAACLASDRLFSSQLGRWTATSSDTVRSSPAGQLVHGLHQAFTAPADAVEPLERAASAFKSQGDVDGEVTAIAQLGRLAWWRQDMPALMTLGARVTELDATGHPKARALAGIAAAMLADMAGDDDEVVARLSGIESGVLDPAWQVLASGLYVSTRLDQGDSSGTYDVVARLRPGADPVLRGVLDLLELAAWWADGRVDDVLARIPTVEAEVRPTGVQWMLYLGYSGGAMAYSRSGNLAEARRCLAVMLEAAPPVPEDEDSLWARAAITTASVRLAEGDEEAATDCLRRALNFHGLERGVDRRMWRQNIDLSYILLPETRAHCDGLALSGHLQVVRELSAAVVAARSESGGASRLRSLELPSMGLVRSSLHHRFATELAVGLAEVGRSEGRALLELLGQPGRDALRSLAAGESRLARPAKSLLTTVPTPPPEPTYLAVLGPLALRRGGRDGEEVIDPALRRRRLHELLAFLVRHRKTSRNVITGALWPDLDESAAGNNLGVTLNHVLRLLEPWRPSGEPAYLLRLEGHSVQLVTGDYLRIDVDEFDERVAAAAQAEADGVPSLALEHHLAAVELYRDELHLGLPEAEWFVLDREHYRSRFVRAAIRAGQLLLARGDVDRAQEVAQRALAVDQWAEEGYAVLISGALARGDRSGARRILSRCRAVLEDLGVEPSDPLQQLSRRLDSTTTPRR